MEFLNNTLQQFSGLPSMQIVALEDALADENYMLEQIAANHTLPLQLRSINCTNVSAAYLEVLRASITTI